MVAASQEQDQGRGLVVTSDIERSMMKKACNENYYYADIGNEWFSLQYSMLCVGCFLTPTIRKIWDRQASVCT